MATGSIEKSQQQQRALKPRDHREQGRRQSNTCSPHREHIGNAFLLIAARIDDDFRPFREMKLGTELGCGVETFDRPIQYIFRIIVDDRGQRQG